MAKALRALEELGQVLSEAGLQTLWQAPDEKRPYPCLLLGLGQDYQDRDQVAYLLCQNEVLSALGQETPDNPSLYTLMLPLPFGCERPQQANLARLLSMFNRLVPSGQFVLTHGGELVWRGQWMIESELADILPLVQLIDMSAFWLNQLVPLIEKVALGQLEWMTAITHLEEQVGRLNRAES